MDPKNFQNGISNPPKPSPYGAKRGLGRPKTLKNTWMQSKSGWGSTALPYFIRKSVQHGPNFASKIEAKPIKDRCKTSSQKLMPSKIDFVKDILPNNVNKIT